MWCFCHCVPCSPHRPTLFLAGSASLQVLLWRVLMWYNSLPLIYFSSLRTMGTFMILCLINQWLPDGITLAFPRKFPVPWGSLGSFEEHVCVPTTTKHCAGHSPRPSMCVLQRVCNVVIKTTDSRVRLYKVEITALPITWFCVLGHTS